MDLGEEDWGEEDWGEEGLMQGLDGIEWNRMDNE